MANRIPLLSRFLLPVRSRRYVIVAVIVIVNLFILLLYFWTRAGATTTVRIEAIDAHYRAFVDGKLVLERTLRGQPEGGIGFLLPQENRLPALPSPYGIDSVRVTDAATGAIIFEDTFDSASSPLWQGGGGNWTVDDGVFTTSESAPVTTGLRPWQDYVMEAKLRNVTEAALYVRAEDAENAIVFNIGPFRSLGGSSIARLDNGVEVDTLTGLKLEVDRGQTIRSITAMLLRPYPFAVVLVLGSVLVAVTLRIASLERRIQSAVTLVPVNAVVVGLAVSAFALLLYLLYVVGEAMPHVPDSVLYVFQAKLFASFNVTADAPPARESFSIFQPHFLQVVDGRWFSHYPFGHPLFLSVGQLVGAVGLVPPALGAASVVLIFWVGKRIYGVTVGLVAAVLLLSSPFFLMTASNFMSHNTAAFTIIVALFFYTLPTKRRSPAMFVAGIFIGLLFNIRPLTAVAFIPVLGGFMVYELLRAGADLRRKIFREDLAFAGGPLIMFGAYLLYNQLTTGNLITSPYALQGTYSTDSIGFGGTHTFNIALQNQQQLLSLLLLVANGWPLAAGLTFAALPFLLGSKNRWDYFLGASAFTIAFLPLFFANAAVMYGPRFWYEIMPFLMLLTARGAQCLAEAGSGVGAWIAERVWANAPGPAPGITKLAVYGMIAVLVAFSINGWLLGQRELWSGQGITNFTPAKASQLKGFNFTDRRLVDLADDMGLQDTLVFVQDCGQWYCYGSTFWNNSPALDGSVVWAELKQTQDDLTVIHHYEDRDIYIADYRGGTIAPITYEEVVQRIADVAREDRQQVIEAQTSTSAERDVTRRADLNRVREVLNECAGLTAGFPDTEGQVVALSTVVISGQDCLLRGLLPSIPEDPLGDPIRDGYWYRSDGVRFVLIALQEEALSGSTNCPADISGIGDRLGRYCLSGSLPQR